VLKWRKTGSGIATRDLAPSWANDRTEKEHIVTTTDPLDLEAQIGAYAERLFGTGLAALEAITISLGRQLGLYEHLCEDDGVTAGELAEKAGIDARYAKEWLEQQAAAGLIDVKAPAADASARRFGLSLAAQECLLRPESLASVGPLFDMLPAVNRVYPAALVDAYRHGTGIPYADYALHDAQGDFNRPAYVNLLASEWLPHVPGLVDRLGGAEARAAEIGCGEGWAAISLAQAFPQLLVDGYDNDEASIVAARKNAADAGVSDRVRFEVLDITRDLPDRVTPGAYDFVVAFEMIHDLARPVEALTTMRRLGKSDAVQLVMDEKVAEAFEAPTENPVERMMYASSVLHCLPVGRTESPSAATGTVMRPSTFAAYAEQAGFSTVDVVPIEHDLFRFYRLVS
jgi:2-polyprenyl-3-methyl-5-hydroxy-6-metoxy-1,4-benzoquinol methylase